MTVSLSDLFDKDPADLTPEDETAIVNALRERREAWAAEESRSKRTGTRASRKKENRLTIEDLGDITVDL